MTRIAIIVVGGSAGSLEALLALLPELPPTFVIPAVVVMHMSADHPSLLPAILGRACRLPVVEIEDKQPLTAGTIYVAAPGYHVLFERDGTLALSADDVVNYSRPSIDVAFESAADAFGAGVVAVVLSGGNDDGARGAARVSEAGGVVLVQDPASAQHPVMPRAALASARASVRVVQPRELGRMLIALASEETRA